MNQQEILKKIGGIIAELNDQYTYLKAAEKGFNELELELFMANAHFLTDHIGILQKINHQPATNVVLPAAKPVLQLQEIPQKPATSDYFNVQELPVAETDQPENLPAKTVEIYTEEIQPLKEAILLPEIMPQENVEAIPETLILPEIEPEKILETDASFTDQKSVAEPDLQEHFELENSTNEQQTVRLETLSLNTQPEAASDFSISSGSETANTAAAVPLTLNERIAAQKGLGQTQSKAASGSKAVQDLQSMISLNDKLLFIKELFNGYNLAYAEAINILNRYTSFEQAENFLNQNYTVKNSWKDKPATMERLMDLLRKRFLVDS